MRDGACRRDSLRRRRRAGLEEFQATARHSQLPAVSSACRPRSPSASILPLASPRTSGNEETQSTRCPSFALLSLDYMSSQCSASGGTLKAHVPSAAWSLDVDGDASAEVLVDLIANFDCDGAPGVFRLRQHGLPVPALQEARRHLGRDWRDQRGLCPGHPGAARRGRQVRGAAGGCLGLEPCSEFVHYEWNGTAYARTWIDFKNHPVDVAPGGLMTLTADSAVIDAPSKRGQVLEEYPAGSDGDRDRHRARSPLLVRFSRQCLPARLRRDGAPQEVALRASETSGRCRSVGFLEDVPFHRLQQVGFRRLLQVRQKASSA